MPAESEQTTGREAKPAAEAKSAILLYPWLVSLAALLLYGLTLKHWVTLGSLPFTSKIMGWDWHPGPLPWRPTAQYQPLFLILTFPLRLLPMGLRVIGLNVFTAACAALTLAILARSVRLLSQDRTKEQRLRVVRSLMARDLAQTQEPTDEQRFQDGEEFALLSVRAAFLPAALAVLLLAAQLTFWEDAVSGSVEIIDLLVFAFLVLSLLEFRIWRNEKWLGAFALLYGLGVANNWALIGFFPCFLVALVWIKGKGFFNWKFMLRMAGLGGLGLLLYALIPFFGAVQHDGSFWELLRQKLAEQHFYLTRMPRYFVFIAGLSTLVPLLFGAIKWQSFEGEVSIGAHGIVSVMFRVLHIVFLAVGILMFFDVKLSPSPRNMGMGLISGSPGFLSFYFLAALGVGYFAGYVLLVFGEEGGAPWERTPGVVRLLNRAVVVLLWVAAIGLPALLFGENFLRMRDFNGASLAQFANEMAKALPAKTAVVLADDPALLYLAKGATQRLGLPGQYIFVETRSLTQRDYLRYLAERHPSFGKELINPDRFPAELSDKQIGGLLARLAQRQPVYYLEPSFGNYFERICTTPRRLGGDVHPYPTNVLATLMLAPAQITTNQAYWRALEKESLASLPELAKRTRDARFVANYYSQMLDKWGADLQMASTAYKLPLLLNDANDQFAEALRLNPNNILARANLQYNARLRGGPPTESVIKSVDIASQFRNHWDAALSMYGPPDVPDLEVQAGEYFAERGLYLQAVHWFQRSLELAPNDPAGELDLAKTYIDLGLVDAAFGLIKNIRDPSSDNALELLRVEALAYATKNDFTQADKLLTEEHNRNPKDTKFTAVMAEFYRLMGYSILRRIRGDPAREQTTEKDAAIWFKKALGVLDEELRSVNALAPDPQEISTINLRKAEIQMTLKDYEAALIPLNALVRQESENPIPLLNRAICEVELDRVDAAKDDYHAVEKMKSAPSEKVYYGLARIARKQNDKSEEIHYDKLYLQYASQNTPEFTNVTQQLSKLERQ